MIPFSEFKRNISSLSYIDYLNGLIVAYILYRCQKFNGLSPNAITTFSLFITLISVCGLFLNNQALFIVCLIISYSLDNADGILARATKTGSQKGAFMDTFFDYIKEYLINIGIIFFFTSNLLGFVGSFNILLFIILIYFTSKSLYFLLSIQIKHEINDFYRSKKRLFIYTPAEKYLVIFPIAIFSFKIMVIVYLFEFFFYTILDILFFFKIKKSLG